jgi:hypothetical protein
MDKGCGQIALINVGSGLVTNSQTKTESDILMVSEKYVNEFRSPGTYGIPDSLIIMLSLFVYSFINCNNLYIYSDCLISDNRLFFYQLKTGSDSC